MSLSVLSLLSIGLVQAASGPPRRPVPEPVLVELNALQERFEQALGQAGAQQSDVGREVTLAYRYAGQFIDGCRDQLPGPARDVVPDTVLDVFDQRIGGRPNPEAISPEALERGKLRMFNTMQMVQQLDPSVKTCLVQIGEHILEIVDCGQEVNLSGLGQLAGQDDPTGFLHSGHQRGGGVFGLAGQPMGCLQRGGNAASPDREPGGDQPRQKQHASDPCGEHEQERGHSQEHEDQCAESSSKKAERGGASHIRAWLDDASVPGLAAAAVAGLEQSPGPAGLEAAIAQRLHDPRFAAATRLERSRHPTLAQLVDRRQEKNSD